MDTGNHHRRVSRAENDRKIYEQLYGVGTGQKSSSNNNKNNSKNNNTRQVSRSRSTAREQEKEEIYGSNRGEAKTKKGTRKAASSSNRKESSAVDLDQWTTTVEPFAVYPDYEPRYVSAMNLRERPTMAMHLQYHHHHHQHLQQQQHQQMIPHYPDYYYYDRGGYGPYAGPQTMYPGVVSQHGKWASDHDISGTLKRMKRNESAAAARGMMMEGEQEQYSGVRRGEFHFNPALFNGQMFRNAQMRYSTESGEMTSSGEDQDEEEQNEMENAGEEEGEDANNPMRAPKIFKSHSEESVDQLSLNVDNSALVNFMRANNEIVNQEFTQSVGGGGRIESQGGATAVATRTTNIRYVTKVYVPRKLQQEQEQRRALDQQQQRQLKPSQIPQRLLEGRKKSLSTDSFFSELEKIDIDEEQNQYELQKRCIEQHLEMLKEHTIKDYDSHDRKKLVARSNSHSTVMVGGGDDRSGYIKQLLPVNRRLSLVTMTTDRKLMGNEGNGNVDKDSKLEAITAGGSKSAAAPVAAASSSNQ